jgi:N-methylhydantoinase B
VTTNAAANSSIELDPIASEVLRSALVNVVASMEYAQRRTAFSLVVRDLRDLACGLHTAPEDGLDLAAVSAGVPNLSAGAHFSLKENVREFGYEALEPGDEIVYNDPYRGGNHAPDITLARPIFDDEGLLAFSTSRSHHVDVGGISMGSWPVGGGVRTIMEETSLRLPPMLIYKAGKAVRSTHSLLLDGTRVPALVLGDLRAQHNANLIGERALLELVDRWGRETVRDAMQYALDYGEARMRAAISAIEDGEYEAEEFIDDDGVTDEPHRLRCKLTVRGNSAELDYSGSDRQTVGNVSAAWGIAAACNHVTIGGMLDPTLPGTGGVFRPVDLILPAGSLVHALPYQACCDGNGTMNVRMQSIVTRLVNEALPARSVGDCYSTAAVATFGGYSDAGPWVLFHAGNGGWGGTEHTDGHTNSQASISNCQDPSIEAMEQDVPVVFTTHEFVCDSAGPGRNRGGMGIVYGFGFREEGVAANSDDRVRSQSFGVAGGKAANPLTIERRADFVDNFSRPTEEGVASVSGLYYDEQGEPVFKTGKFLGRPIEKDEVWFKYVPGGGGWGDPLERDPEKVVLDLRNGLVSSDGAERDYGVVVREDLSVDDAATTARRQQLAGDAAYAEIPCPARWHHRPLAEEQKGTVE